MFLTLIDKKLFDNKYFYFGCHLILYSALLRRDPAFKEVEK